MSGRWYVERERRFVGLGSGVTPLQWSAYYSDGGEGAFLGAYSTKREAEAALEDFKRRSPEGYVTVAFGPAGVSTGAKPKGT